MIARHPRSYEQEDFVFDPLHYLSLLEQKTNALDQAAPLAGWLLPPVFGDLRRLLEARMGKAGKREYVQVLRLIESFSLDDVRAAISEALERGVIGFDAVTLVMPSVNAKVMDLFLAHFADTLDQDAHAVMMCDGAGWHDERALTVPDNVTLALLPPYSPELNPVERVWLYLRERFLSLRVLDDTEAIIDACCQAWIDLIAEPDRMRTLCAYPWIMKVIS